MTQDRGDRLYPPAQTVAGERKIGLGPRDAAAGDHRHHLLAASPVLIAHTGTVAETTVDSIIIAGDETRSKDTIIMRMVGLFVNGTGSDQTFRIQVKGDTTGGTDVVFLDHTSIALASHASQRRALKMEIVINGWQATQTRLWHSSSAHLLIGALDTATQSGPAGASAVVDEALQFVSLVGIVPGTSTTINTLLTLSDATLSTYIEGAISYQRV